MNRWPFFLYDTILKSEGCQGESANDTKAMTWYPKQLHLYFNERFFYSNSKNAPLGKALDRVQPN